MDLLHRGSIRLTSRSSSGSFTSLPVARSPARAAKLLETDCGNKKKKGETGREDNGGGGLQVRMHLGENLQQISANQASSLTRAWNVIKEVSGLSSLKEQIIS